MTLMSCKFSSIFMRNGVTTTQTFIFIILLVMCDKARYTVIKRCAVMANCKLSRHRCFIFKMAAGVGVRFHVIKTSYRATCPLSSNYALPVPPNAMEIILDIINWKYNSLDRPGVTCGVK